MIDSVDFIEDADISISEVEVITYILFINSKIDKYYVSF